MARIEVNNLPNKKRVNHTNGVIKLTHGKIIGDHEVVVCMIRALISFNKLKLTSTTFGVGGPLSCTLGSLDGDAVFILYIQSCRNSKRDGSA